MRSLLLIALGAVGLIFGVSTLVTTIKSGTARLRGGPLVTAARQPYLFRANVVALCAAILIFGAMLYLGVTAS